MQIYILNQDQKVVGTLTSEAHNIKATPFFEDQYTLDLETGAETFSFQAFANSPQTKNIIVGNYVAFKFKGDFKLFRITETTDEHGEEFLITAYCEMAGIELSNEVVKPRSIASATLQQFVTTCLMDTGWLVGSIDPHIVDVHTIEIENYSTVYSTLQNHVVKTYGGELAFRVEIDKGKVVAKYVDVYKKRGTFNGFRFSYDKNIESIKRSVDTSELATALIGVGQDNITFASVFASDKPMNQDWIGDEEAYKRWNKNGNHIVGTFNYDTDSPTELLNKTREELQRRKNPKITYELSVGYEDDLGIGDTVYVVDNEFEPALHLSARVKNLTISFTDVEKGSCTLSNFKDVNSNITEEMKQLASLINSKFPIGTDQIEDNAITSDKLDEDSVSGNHIQHDTLIADHIKAYAIKTDHLDAKVVTAEKINAKAINADHIQANSIKGEHIEGKTITGDKIEGGTITGELIQGNSIGADHIQSGALTSDKMVISNGFIKDVMVDTVSASKIVAGKIDTSKVTIESENGRIVLADATQQFKDKNGNVRVQIGEDAEGDFTFCLFDETGEGVLIDHNGLKEKAVSDGLIKNDMIGDGEINGSKVNINSIIDKVNSDGTKTFNASKVKLDTENQTLDVSFKQMNTKLENLKVGGRNLIKNSTFNMDLDKWEVTNKNQTTIEKGGIDGGRCLKTVGAIDTTTFVCQTVPLKPNTTYTFTGWYKSEDVVHGDTEPYVRFYIAYKKNEIFKRDLALNEQIEETNDWTKVTKTFTTRSANDWNAATFYCYVRDCTGTVWFDQLQIEEGNMATDWTPANEDVEDKFEVLETAITTEQGKIATLIANTTVIKDGKETTLKDAHSKLEQTVNGINTKVTETTTKLDGVDVRVSNAESNISQTASAISQTVKKTDYNGNTIKSLINQSADSIKIQAKNIDLQGAVTVLSDIAGELGTITAGEITAQTKIDVGTDMSVGRTIHLNQVTSGANYPEISFRNYRNIQLGRIGFEGRSATLVLSGDNIKLGGINDAVSFGEYTTYYGGSIKDGFVTYMSETGYCGVGGMDSHGFSRSKSIAGNGVNFRMKKRYAPSSVSLSTKSTTGTFGVYAIDITVDGFWLYITGCERAGNYCFWRGTYRAKHR